jgi:hypothetical protein
MTENTAASGMVMHTSLPATIRIELDHIAQLPQAYEMAINKFVEDDGENWGHSISLVKVEFEKNFRREFYVAVFKVERN